MNHHQIQHKIHLCDLYLGRRHYKFQFWHWMAWWRIFVKFKFSSRKISESTPDLSKRSFLVTLSWIHYSSHDIIQRYIYRKFESVLICCTSEWVVVRYVSRRECRSIVLSYNLFCKADKILRISGRINFIRANNVELNYKESKHSTAIIFLLNLRLNYHFNQFDTEWN